MGLYDRKDYRNAAATFDKIYSLNISANKLYDGACIYALNGEKQKAFDVLFRLAEKEFYSNLEHISKDGDLNSLHEDVKWPLLLEKIKVNKDTREQRKLTTIYDELNKAKQLLEADAGRLWGSSIWDDCILVLDFDNTVYSIKVFPGSRSDDGKLYYAKVAPGTLTFVNTVQSYQGKSYAVVMINYLSDNSITIIHELFHLLQFKVRKLNGDAIKYLDNYDARELLRLEYHALRTALHEAREKSSIKKINNSIADALRFRKIRQAHYKSYLQNEIEIETLEGLANYTGFALSSKSDKLSEAIDEIYQRENAQTYTRPFPYATGVAYGLLFDYLGIRWKTGLDSVYNFLTIYEKAQKIAIDTSEASIKKARSVQNYIEIHKEEEDRRIQNEKLIAYYRNLLHDSPTLRVEISDIEHYGRTFNMNGTIELKGLGTVYSSITGRDKSGKSFGSFKTIEDKSVLGNAGILMLSDDKTLVFPAPFKVQGNKIIGDTYEIELNEGWGIEKSGETGNYIILKK